MPHGPRFQQLCRDVKAHVREVTAAEAAEAQAGGTILIDVREQAEFEQKHARGAIHLSKGVVEMKIEAAVPDAEAAIICYCGGGNRSALVAENLQRMGYKNVRSLTGGFKAWEEAGLPIES